ncbi:MAG: GntR family transcriptional regulator [Planctomycetes bacterium]|nr:GntR family transcriptional regulator [Planctomycetota bacterium]
MAMQKPLVPVESLEKNLTYAEKAFRALKRMIMLGQLPSGGIINERELSEQLGISRTPLRDALQLLEAKGWVVKRGKSRSITEFNIEELMNDIQIRCALEALAVDLAMDRLTDADLQVMAGYVETMGKRDLDHVSFLEADQQFHVHLGKISGNSKLYGMLDDSCEQILRYSILFLKSIIHRRDQVQREHQKMYDLLVRRDKAGYIAAIQEHLVQSSPWLRGGQAVTIPDGIAFPRKNQKT